MKKLFLVGLVVSGLPFVAVQRSDAQIETGNSGNRDWTGRQLRLSPFRIRVFSPRGILLPATRLWGTEDRHTIHLKGISVFPSPPLSSA